MSSTRNCLALALVASALYGMVPRAQVPGAPLTFRTSVDLVQVAVRVLDESNEFFSGLTATDFDVFEDGAPQEIASFQAVDVLNGSAPSALAEMASSTTAQAPKSARMPQRVYVFLVDNLLLSAVDGVKARGLVSDFVTNKLAPDDAGAVIPVSVPRILELTSDRAVLAAAAARIAGSFDRDVDGPFTRLWNRRLRTTLLSASAWLGSLPARRKSLIVISPRTLCSIVTDASGRLRDDGGSVSCGALLESAVNSQVSVYSIDPRGPVVPHCAMAEYSGASCGSSVRSAAARFNSTLAGARTLAEETGGFAVTSTNSFDAVFDRIVAENSTYYLIGYYSTNTKRDGKFRRHEIKVNHPAARVLHRAGYLSPRQRP